MRERLLVAAGPAVFVLLWSTGFVGARYGLPYAEPFTFLAVRLVVAAVLLALAAAVSGSGRLAGWTDVRHSAVVGVLLHAGYLGGFFTAISLGMPAGTTSVLVGLQPVLTSVLAVRLLDERLRPAQWAGLVLGVGGVVLVLAPALSGAVTRGGLLACGVALCSATAATLYQKRSGGDVPLLWGTSAQYAAAALVLGGLALTTETRHITWTGEFVAALAWLTGAISLGAVLLLLALLRRGSASGVSSLLYLVPPVTAVESFLLFDERLAPVSLVGVAVTAVGVALVVRRPRSPVAAA